MALIAAHLNAGHSGGDSVAICIYTLPLPPPPYPLPPPSLISLMVSVGVKHHILTYLRFTFKTERRSVIYKLIRMLLELVVDASIPCSIQRAPHPAPIAASRTLVMYALTRK